MHVVSGTIELQGWQGESGPATVYVRLLDTARMDMPARQVAETVLHDVALDQVQESGLDFQIGTEELDPRARYEVSVLVDLDGDGVKGTGDYVTTASHPVLSRGYPVRVQVHVTPIAGSKRGEV